MTPDQERAFIEWATEITRAISLTCREPMIIRRLSRTMGEMWRTFGYTEIDFQGNPVRPGPWPMVLPITIIEGQELPPNVLEALRDNGHAMNCQCLHCRQARGQGETE